MPTAQWMKERRMITVWLSSAQYEKLRRGCETKGLSMAGVIRKGIDAMLLFVEDA